ncbi:Histone H1E [Araneus ventricosus]|uniref:Histone H1E n=1 Tax=Araneus ventricosus TaxID=182803 RepID=A0A4Y2UNN7_ARAVE|nr:Histone H1E [Araneus ventricosus]
MIVTLLAWMAHSWCLRTSPLISFASFLQSHNSRALETEIVLKSCDFSHQTLNGSLRIKSSVDFDTTVSLKATVRACNDGLFTPPVAGALLQAALVASCSWGLCLRYSYERSANSRLRRCPKKLPLLLQLPPPPRLKRQKVAQLNQQPSTHPKVSEMVVKSITTLKEQVVLLCRLSKVISSEYKVDIDRLTPFIRKYLKSAVAAGTLVQTKARANGSFKLSASGQKTKSLRKLSKAAPLQKQSPARNCQTKGKSRKKEACC